MAEQTLNTVLDMEWEMFDRVQNIGGRASCQDNRETFYLNRSSQLMAWDGEVLESYARDLRRARLEGRNLLSEKYGYMMQRTSPEEYEVIRDRLPVRSEEKLELMERICKAHLVWLREVSECYPHLTGRGRAMERAEDSPFTTSFETYLWGELGTYSLPTLQLYWQQVVRIQQEGGNMNRDILRNTVTQYGYPSLEAAEERLANGR